MFYKRSGIKKQRLSAVLFLLLFLHCFGRVPVFAAPATPLYRFEYNGSVIETYGSFSRVDGEVVDGFRYYVKDGKLTVVDQGLNAVPDGIFIHYEDGESYIAVLTKGGRLVSLGSVNLPEHLDKFKNSGIRKLASNVNSHSRELVVTYTSGAIIGYDAVTGEELYRSGAVEEKDTSIKEYLEEHLTDLVRRTSVSSKDSAKKDAEKIISIMEEKGYSLEDVAASGVLTDEESLQNFIDSGSLTGDHSNGVSNQNPQQAGENIPGSSAEAESVQNGGSSGAETANANSNNTKKTETGATGAQKESTSAAGDGVDIRSAETVTKESTAAGEKAAEAESGAEKQKETEKESAQKNKSGEPEASESRAAGEEKTGDAKDNGAKTKDANNGKAKTGSAKTGDTEKKTVGSAVIQDPGGKTDGKNGLSGTAAEKGKGGDQAGNNGTESEKKESGKEAGAAAGTGTSGEDRETMDTSGRKEKTDGAGTGDGEGGDGEAEAAEDTEESTGNSVLTVKNTENYVSVFNPDTGSYEIYSVEELMEHPEDPKSENSKLDNADNRQIAALLKVKEDEKDERGVGLYVVIVLAVLALMVLAILGIRSKTRQEEQTERMLEERKRQQEAARKEQEEEQ